MINRQADLIKNMTDKDILVNLYVTQLLIVVVAAILGYFLFPDLPSFLRIWEWDVKEIFLFGGGSAIIVIALDGLLMKILPKHLYDDGGINERVFQNRPVWHSFLICVFVSISEELLFRGMIQTHFGLIVASIVFALLHVRYLYKWILFVVVVTVSFLIGWLYQITGNLTAAFFMHFLIDFAAALIIKFQHKRLVND